jgi:hypothetical protein
MSREPIMQAIVQMAMVTISALCGSPCFESCEAYARKGTAPSEAMALSSVGATIRHCSACEMEAITMPICTASADGQAMAPTTSMLSVPPPSSRLPPAKSMTSSSR